MAEYIEREATLKVIFGIMSDCKVRHKCRAINRNVKQIPTADVVEVVRCKDCEFYKHTEIGDCMACIRQTAYKKPNDFCSYGIKRGDTND